MFRASSDTAVTSRVRPTTENPIEVARSRVSLRARAMSSSTRIGTTDDGTEAAGPDRTDAGSVDRADAGDPDRTDAGSVDRADEGGGDRTEAGSVDRADEGGVAHTDAASIDRAEAGGAERASRSAWIAAQHSSTLPGSPTNRRRLRSIGVNISASLARSSRV